MKSNFDINEIYWCPNCYRSTHINATGTLDIEYVKAKVQPRISWDVICDKCGIDMVMLDTEVFEHVALLNKKGYKTIFSCAGHSIYSPAYISFDIETSNYLVDENISEPEYWLYTGRDVGTIINPDNGITYFDDGIGDVVTLRPYSGEVTKRLISRMGYTWDKVHQTELDSLLTWITNLPNRI